MTARPAARLTLSKPLPTLSSMDVHLDNPNLEAKINQWVTETGHSADELVENALTGLATSSPPPGHLTCRRGPLALRTAAAVTILHGDYHLSDCTVPRLLADFFGLPIVFRAVWLPCNRPAASCPNCC